MKIHLDTDLGGDLDDLCALAMLLRWEGVEIAGITVVGDTGGRRTGYVKRVLEIEGRDEIPVKMGAENSPEYYRHDLGLPDEQRYWRQSSTPSPNPPDEAIELLKQSVESGATLIGIGPYTNFYLLERRYPGILKDATLAQMGGYVAPVREGYPDWRNEF
ncbi:MAG: nucleoside hydrolase, partial [Candidatus Poribacteria bacterium]|nr:nucleoside hydrolase [Candidatus Poribacteria bacterium]